MSKEQKYTCSNPVPILKCEHLKDICICTKKEKCFYKMNWSKINNRGK